jgi:hypothetical protein
MVSFAHVEITREVQAQKEGKMAAHRNNAARRI